MNWKDNIPPFYMGQKVVYITGICMQKDSVHTITDFFRDPCGCYVIGINGVPIITKGTAKRLTQCDQCQKILPTPMWGGKSVIVSGGWQASSFRPLESQTLPSIKLSEIKEKEKEEILIEN